MQNIFTNLPLQLESGQLKALRLRRPVCLQIACGKVWVTIEGGSRDYTLSAGQQLELPGSGLLVIEAIGQSSQIRLMLCHPQWRQRVWAASIGLSQYLWRRLRGNSAAQDRADTASGRSCQWATMPQ